MFGNEVIRNWERILAEEYQIISSTLEETGLSQRISQYNARLKRLQAREAQVKTKSQSDALRMLAELKDEQGVLKQEYAKLNAILKRQDHKANSLEAVIQIYNIDRAILARQKRQVEYAVNPGREHETRRITLPEYNTIPAQLGEVELPRNPETFVYDGVDKKRRESRESSFLGFLNHERKRIKGEISEIRPEEIILRVEYDAILIKLDDTGLFERIADYNQRYQEAQEAAVLDFLDPERETRFRKECAGLYTELKNTGLQERITDYHMRVRNIEARRAKSGFATNPSMRCSRQLLADKIKKRWNYVLETIELPTAVR